MNWKTLYNPADVIGEVILLRESQSYTSNTTLVAGTIAAYGDNGFAIRDYDGKILPLRDDYSYHYIKVKEILF